LLPFSELNVFSHNLCVLTLSLLRTPRSTLFPYTTLFRSWPGDGGGPPNFLTGHRVVCTDEADVFLVPRATRHARDNKEDVCFIRDRKSTRLNSSHVSISYAVFCLKQKQRLRARRPRLVHD